MTDARDTETLAEALAEPLCKAICDLLGEPRILVPGEVSALLSRVTADLSIAARIGQARAGEAVVPLRVNREHEDAPWGCSCGAKFGDGVDRRWHLLNETVKATLAYVFPPATTEETDDE